MATIAEDAAGRRPAIMERRGWFADVDNDDERNMEGWQPVLQVSGFCLDLDIWFKTEAECEAFIREEIIPAAGQMIPELT